MPATININLSNILGQQLAENKIVIYSDQVVIIEGLTVKPGTKIGLRTNKLGLGTVSLSPANYWMEVLDRQFEFGVPGNATYELASLISLTIPSVIQRGLPAGGTLNQVLAKASANAYDVVWINLGSAADKNFQQVFNSTVSLTINHNLNKFPSTVILDSTLAEVEALIIHNTINQFTVTFSALTSGTITCN